MKLIQTSKNLIRPKTLIASVSPVLLSSAWALKEDCFSFILFCLLISTALSLQILSNIANDYFDGLKGTDDSLRIGPVRLAAQGPKQIAVVKKFLLASFALTLALGLFLSFAGGPVIAAVFALSIICAIIYTAGPFAISYHGKAEPFAFSFFGPIPTFFAAFIFSKSFHLSSLILGFLPGFYSLILITMNNLRDFESDSAHQKHTLIVKYGREFGKKLIKFSLYGIIASTIILGVYQPKILFSLVLIPEMMRYFYHIKKAQKAEEFSMLFKESSRIYLLSTILWLCFYMI